MTCKTQPEALRLADRLTPADYYEFDASLHCPQAAAELRRLHAENTELLEALKILDEAYCNVGQEMNRKDRADGRQALIKARAAITKATGETK